MKEGECRIKSLRITDVNKSHAACYSYITVLTGYFKTYHPAKFMASLLTMQTKDEKIEQYIKIAKDMNIQVSAPHINDSCENFVEKDGRILFGLGSIKGVGESSIPAIIENKPYVSLEDAVEKAGKKFMNKRVGLALIKAGAFDFENENRFEMINRFYDLRKDKDDRLNDENYQREECMIMEKEVLGTSITYTSLWDGIKANEEVEIDFEIKSVNEKTDKNGKLMAFADGLCDGSPVRALIFSSQYLSNRMFFERKMGDIITLSGKKDEKGTLVVSKVSRYVKEMDEFSNII